MEKIIIHIDINSCFASLEQQDNPKWRNKPLGVVQDSGKRGVIIASSIEAKKLGIGTGHLVWQAKGICPEIILVPASFSRYVEYARKFREVCRRYSYRVEVFSIDELFIDVSKTAHLFGGPIELAKEIKQRLKTEVGDYLTCSVGIAENKMLAKLASGSEKPDGMVVVKNKDKLNFLDKSEIWHICGIGKRIQKRLNKLGVFSILQMRQIPRKFLVREFGVMGNIYSDWAKGEDFSEVMPSGVVPNDKSYGNQLTLPEEVGLKEAKKVILWLSWQVASRMRCRGMGGRTVSVYIRKKNESAYTQKSVSGCRTARDIYMAALYILEHKLDWKKSVRFVGISISNLFLLSSLTLPVLSKDLKWYKISLAWDAICNKHDPFYLRPASLLNMNLKKEEFNGFTKKF